MWNLCGWAECHDFAIPRGCALICVVASAKGELEWKGRERVPVRKENTEAGKEETTEQLITKRKPGGLANVCTAESWLLSSTNRSGVQGGTPGSPQLPRGAGHQLVLLVEGLCAQHDLEQTPQSLCVKSAAAQLHLPRRGALRGAAETGFLPLLPGWAPLCRARPQTCPVTRLVLLCSVVSALLRARAFHHCRRMCCADAPSERGEVIREQISVTSRCWAPSLRGDF